MSCDQAARTKLALENSRSKLIHHQFQRFGEGSVDKFADMASAITSLLALCIALLAAASPIAQVWPVPGDLPLFVKHCICCISVV